MTFRLEFGNIKATMKVNESNGIKILLAMPCGRQEESLRTLLRGLGRGEALHQANSLLEIRHLMSVWQPDAVFLDLDMPSGESLQILHEIKQQCYKICCIGMANSAYQMKLADEAGADVTLLKGFSAAIVNTVINRVCSSAQNLQIR